MVGMLVVMNTFPRLLCGACVSAAALALTACSSSDLGQSTAVAAAPTAARSTRAPDTYRPVGTNIPVATPAPPMSDSEKQDFGDYLSRYPGFWGKRG